MPKAKSAESPTTPIATERPREMTVRPKSELKGLEFTCWVELTPLTRKSRYFVVVVGQENFFEVGLVGADVDQFAGTHDDRE